MLEALKHCDCSMEENFKVGPQADKACSMVASIDNLEADEVGVAFDETLHIQDDVGIASQKLDHIGEEALAVNQKLDKCVTFPTRSCASSMDGKDGVPLGAVMHVENSLKPGNPYFRSLSFPTSTKLVSAMKGSRGQQGTPQNSNKMSVTWAPDVQDPPATSLSHTLTGSHSQQLQGKSIGRKGSHKHKQKGGIKSSRRSCERKHRASWRGLELLQRGSL